MAIPGLPNVASVGAAVLPNIDPRVWQRELTNVLPGVYGKAAAAAGGAIAAGLAASLGTALRAGDLFVDFEQSLTKITTLVGIAEDEVQGFGEAILDLAPSVGRGPQELADALFFITSAGLRGGDALDALDASAKAAALGLGETQVVADAATSALNAYGDAGLTAEEAVGVLVKTVEQGKLEADSLAGAIGRVIPIASEAGVSFNEVGAALAAVSRTGLDAQEGATALRGILATVVRPTQQAKDALAEYGLTTESLAATLDQDGLIGLLDLLRSSVGDNTEALATIIPNIRALTGFLSLTGSQADSTRRIFSELEVVTGVLDERFAQLQDTNAFRRQQAEAERLAILTGEGAEAAEALTGILETIPGVLEQIIPPLAAVGTGLLEFGGNVLGGVANLTGRLGELTGGAISATDAVLALGGAFGLLTANPVVFAITTLAGALAGMGAADARLRSIADTFLELFSGGVTASATEFADAAERIVDAFDQDSGFFDQVIRGATDVGPVLAEVGLTVDEFVQSVIDNQEALEPRKSTAFNIAELLGLPSDLNPVQAITLSRAFDDVTRSYQTAQQERANLLEGGFETPDGDFIPKDANANVAGVDESIAGIRALRTEAQGLGGDISAVDALTLTDIAGQVDSLGQALFGAAAEGKSVNDALNALADPVFSAIDAVTTFNETQAKLPDVVNRSTTEQLEYAQALADVKAAVGNLDPGEIDAFFATLEDAGVDIDAILADIPIKFDEVGELVGSEIEGAFAPPEGLGDTLLDDYNTAIDEAFALISSGLAEPVKEDGELVGVAFADGTVIPLGELSTAFTDNIDLSGVAGTLPLDDWGRPIGAGVADGIVEGVPSTLSSRLAAAINTEIAQADRIVRDRWGIDSPSKVFADRVGVPLGEGIAVGADRALGSLSDVFNDRIAAAADRYASPGSLTGSTTGGSTVFNIIGAREESIAAGIQRGAAVARVVIS